MCQGGSGKFDKNGAVWCILSVPKLVIINLKFNTFFIINQQPKFCAIFLSKINQDAHFGTKINTFTFYKENRGWGGGLIALRSQRNVKKTEALRFYSKYYIPDAKIYPVMMWIQILARGGGGGGADFFLLKRCNMAHSECSQICYYQPENQQF